VGWGWGWGVGGGRALQGPVAAAPGCWWPLCALAPSSRAGWRPATSAVGAAAIRAAPAATCGQASGPPPVRTPLHTHRNTRAAFQKLYAVAREGRSCRRPTYIYPGRRAARSCLPTSRPISRPREAAPSPACRATRPWQLGSWGCSRTKGAAAAREALAPLTKPRKPPPGHLLFGGHCSREGSENRGLQTVGDAAKGTFLGCR
jgi:hypothetical protein